MAGFSRAASCSSNRFTPSKPEARFAKTTDPRFTSKAGTRDGRSWAAGTGSTAPATPARKTGPCLRSWRQTRSTQTAWRTSTRWWQPEMRRKWLKNSPKFWPTSGRIPGFRARPRFEPRTSFELAFTTWDRFLLSRSQINEIVFLSPLNILYLGNHW